MNNILSSYLNWAFLNSPPSSVWFLRYGLYIFILAVTLPVILGLFFKFKKRNKVYQNFDKKWFWGYLFLGLVGFFIWFSYDQGLPTFGTRIAILVWLISLVLWAVYLVIYYKKSVTKEIDTYHEKKRKEKYFKR